MNWRYLLIIITFFSANGMRGQSTSWSNDYALSLGQTDFKSKRVIPPTPEAAELGKYGNTPVSLFTGTPQISIPLFELKGNSLSLPISLSYNASGFKPQEIAPWSGLGWSLNAGGVITRSVIGNPDVVGNFFNSSYNYLNTPTPVTDLFAKYDYIYNIQKGWMETQPDMYFYNFGGYSGKFLITKGQVVNKKKKDNLKISHCITCPSSTMTTIDENGITYEFDDVEYSNMVLDDAVSGDIPATLSYNNYPTSWFITSMTSADGQEQILFEYYTTDSTNNLLQNFLQNKSQTYYSSTQTGYTSAWAPVASTVIQAPPTISVKRKYLKKISLKRNGQTIAYIDFISGLNQRLDISHIDFPQERLLQGVNIYEDNSLVKQYSLGYNYFVNSNGPSTFRRLRLDTLKQLATNGITPSPPPYLFNYNTNSLVPSYTGASVDHWGFYNNTDGISSLIPNMVAGDGTTLGNNANRSADFNGSSCGILNKITYPTGGYTSFDYELNQAWDPGSSANYNVGGVRIKTITDYSFLNKQAIVKNYQYTADDGLSSSGQSSLPVYYKSSSYHYTSYANDGIGHNYDTYYWTGSASSVFGLGSAKGSHIGYTKVTETQTDAVTFQPLGKAVYRYKIGLTDENTEDASAGSLLQQTMYDVNNKIIKDITNSYNYIGTTSTIGYKLFTETAQDNFNQLCKATYDNGSSYVFEWRNPFINYTPACTTSRQYMTRFSFAGYIVSGTDIQLAQTDEKTYDQLSNTYTTQTKKYTYGNPLHTFPTLIEQTSSGNDEIVTAKKYAGDFTVPSGGTLDNPTAGIKTLQDKNMIGAEIESVQYRKNLDGSNLRYLGGILTMYQPSSPYPQYLYRSELAVPVTSFQYAATNGNLSYDPSYKLSGTLVYGAFGNLLQQYKVQDAIKSYIWDYNYTLPTAEVSNADAGSIAYTSFESMGTGGNWTISNMTANTIAGGLTGKLAYNLQSGNSISSGCSAAGLNVVSYWVAGSTPVSVVTNAGSAAGTATVVRNGWTYFEHVLPAGSSTVTLTASGITLDELRLYPKNALMTTIAYTPGIGINSQCSALGQLQYYEYDGLNRLANIKDDNGSIVKNYQYNYGAGAALTASAQTLFYSNAAQGSFTKAGCPVGTTPSTVVYSVPALKYVSSTDQPTANAKATADVSSNGQAYANANGQCLYYNATASGFFFKNNCSYSQGSGSRVRYTVAAGTYSSTVDQTSADALASTDVTNNGQAYANANGTCSCGAEGQKYINGVCTTGTRHNSSTTHMADGTWQCIYYYAFSDNTVSPNYTVYGSSACSIQ